MTWLGRLAIYSVEGVSLSIALVVVALFGISLYSILGAGLLYLGIRAIIKSWILDHPLPSPMQVALYVLALFGLIGGTQFTIFVAVLISVFLLKEVKLKWPTLEGFIESLKMGLLGAVAPIFSLILPVIPAYEAMRMLRRDFGGGLALLLMVFLGFIGFWLSALQVTEVLELLQFGIFAQLFGYKSLSNPLLWVGIIAYEEFIGRVNPFANAMFTLLHIPSRLTIYETVGSELIAVSVTAMILLLINFGARWLFEIYRQHGIVASIAGHAVYNAAVSSFVGFLTNDPLPYMLFLFLGLVGFIYSLGSRRL